MTKRAEITCNQCFFRSAELCALPGNTPCPTFRAASAKLTPPRQPTLVLRPPVQAPAAA